MNGYICLYKGHQIEIMADTVREAKQKAIEIIKSSFNRRLTDKNSYQISVYLVEREGKQVTTHID